MLPLVVKSHIKSGGFHLCFLICWTGKGGSLWNFRNSFTGSENKPDFPRKNYPTLLAYHARLCKNGKLALPAISFAQNGYYSPSKTSNSIYFIPCRWHYEYKSKCTLWGVPVLHIHFADRGLARATGIFAIGNSSFGLVSLGGISVGLFSLGGLSLGTLSFGGIALGAMAWGGCAIGALAAFGGLAVGNVAMGGCAVGDVAIGSKAVGDTAFSLGEGIHATAQVWNEFCHAVQARGFGYQLLSYILSHVKLF